MITSPTQACELIDESVSTRKNRIRCGLQFKNCTPCSIVICPTQGPTEFFRGWGTCTLRDSEAIDNLLTLKPSGRHNVLHQRHSIIHIHFSKWCSLGHMSLPHRVSELFSWPRPQQTGSAISVMSLSSDSRGTSQVSGDEGSGVHEGCVAVGGGGREV